VWVDEDAARPQRLPPRGRFARPFGRRAAAAVKALFILIVLPALVGIAAEWHYRDPRKASLAAASGAVLAVAACVQALDPAQPWNWIAAILVSPLAIAIAVVAALYCYGRAQLRGRPRRHRG
jgi:hypothetical protein